MSSLAILQSLKEAIVTANVKAVYGEPISVQGRTIIPVAKITYGYGGGGGTGGVGNSGARGEGGGGGGLARAIPVGVVEVTDQQTRFAPITERRKLVGAVVMGIGLGMLLERRDGVNSCVPRYAGPRTRRGQQHTNRFIYSLESAAGHSRKRSGR
jgi:uncharacterized spore protein YtfJ